MSEYVSKETMQAKLNRKRAGPANKRYTEGWNDAILMVKSMIHSEKAANVDTVRNGRWIQCNYMDKSAKCSECGGYYTRFSVNERYPNYCPHCGCKMNLEG